MTPERWAKTCAYLGGIVGGDEGALAGIMERAVRAGIPDIAVSADVGRLLLLLTRMTGVRRALELGTLAGYSGTWIARGMEDGGRLYTVEPEAKHADFAARTFEENGVGDRVTIMRTTALEAISSLHGEYGDASFDLIFADAIKSEYPDYWRACRGMIRRGGVFIADNALGSDSWWIDSPGSNTASSSGADALNRIVCADAEFDAGIVTNRRAC
ncbi:MAG: class I SAM-dependent methyltransferase [Phycisphaerales bacterium]